MSSTQTGEPPRGDRTSHRSPVVLTDTTAVARLGGVNAAGAVWRLQEPSRDLDSNIIALPPGGRIQAHDGPAIDVLIHVLAGSGRLLAQAEVLELRPGVLAWLPRGSRRLPRWSDLGGASAAEAA